MNYKKLEDYDDYIIFKTGKVYSLKSNIFMKHMVNNVGYLQVSLSTKGQKNGVTYGIHRLL